MDAPTQLKNLPAGMADYSLVDWQTVASVFKTCVPKARQIVKENGIPLVAISERKRLPRWGAIREFILNRETL